ncbi:MAG: D-alanyl-D-alanine carboxypeptidase/D-alanyl-D-alanine-endopeptidase [Solirubrobacterales bacterium]|nr:D-alanyl-D-alanine carboxypeptidase/D-alanyl-D-alanine-endopeptidase [Solirubrobacterales bacterium]
MRGSATSPRRGVATALALVVALLAATPAAAQEGDLGARLAGAIAGAGSYSGAYVVNADTGRPVLRWRHTTPRVLASNTKLFTTAAAFDRFGVRGTLATEVRGVGEVGRRGVWRGPLYLVGGGDPTFGSESFSGRAYGTPVPSVEDLALELQQAGIRRVAGRVIGDESGFDGRRGGPDSGWHTSYWIGGPLSALGFNRGLGNESGTSFQADPASFAAARLTDALRQRGIAVTRTPRSGRAPSDAERVAAVRSPPMYRLARLVNKPSDNYAAEMLVKASSLDAGGRGRTTAGARLAANFAARLGAGPARLADGSGLSRLNRASPQRVVALLLGMREREDGKPFMRSLAIAGRDGTLSSRMRSGPARGRCRAKTGTLTGVTALSGFCRARSGALYAYSILMNGVDTYSGRYIQDRMLQAIAGVR